MTWNLVGVEIVGGRSERRPYERKAMLPKVAYKNQRHREQRAADR